MGGPPTVRLSAEAAPVPSDVPRALQICIDRCLRFFSIEKSILTVIYKWKDSINVLKSLFVTQFLLFILYFIVIVLIQIILVRNISVPRYGFPKSILGPTVVLTNTLF